MLKMRKSDQVRKFSRISYFLKESAELYTGDRSRQRVPPWLPHKFLHAALIKRLEIFPIEEIFSTSRNNLSVFEYHQDVVAEAARPSYIVEHHHEGAALPPQFLEKLHHAKLMPQVEVLQGFIQQVILWRLSKQQGNPRTLAFPAGKRAKGSVGDIGQFHPFYGFKRNVAVGRPPAKQGIGVGMPSQEHVFPHVSPKFPGFFLQQHAQMTGKIPAGPAFKQLASQTDE